MNRGVQRGGKFIVKRGEGGKIQNIKGIEVDRGVPREWTADVGRGRPDSKY